MFGAPPLRDIDGLRNSIGAAADSAQRAALTRATDAGA